MPRRRPSLSPPQILSLGYLVLIASGTIALKLPAATTTPITWSDALFTSTSSATVTGLAVVDPGTTFTVLGEAILMVLMQMGGLGLMTFALLTFLLLGRRIGLRQRMVAGDAFGIGPGAGIGRLVKTLVVFALTVEAIGAALLSLRLVPELGLVRGLWESLFHAVSAFNNAGVGLRSDSLVGWVTDPLVGVVISALFIVGGLGFTVVTELIRTRRWSGLSLHAQLMIGGTVVLNLVAALAFFAMERGNAATIGTMDLSHQLHASWVQGTTPRTAGFNIVDMTQLGEATLLMTMVLMFIGAGSASTAGGIKLTTSIILVVAAFSFIRGHAETRLLGRSIAVPTVLRAMTITVISIGILATATFLLLLVEDQAPGPLAFEAISAFATVGLSIGATSNLEEAGRFIIVVLMYLGRIGPLAMAYAFAKRVPAVVGYPRGDVLTG